MPSLAAPHIILPAGPLNHAQVTTAARTALRDGILGDTTRPWRRAADKWIRWMAGFGDAVEAKILDHIFNDGTYAAPTPNLALGTGAISDSDVAATFGGTTEANYTGYTRVAIAAADVSAAAAGSKTNSNAITFPACSGSSSVVIAWCVTSSGATVARLSAGDVIVYGTCTSTTVDVTHTPPTVASSGLVVNLD